MKDWREDCLDRLTSSSASSADILKALSGIVNQLGFEYCSYVLRVPYPIVRPTVTWASTYPTKWLTHYFTHDYFDSDPLIRRASKETSPVIWACDQFDGQPDFWEEARAHGVRYGWALSTHGKRMTIGMLSLARTHHKVTGSELAETEPQLYWLSHVTHGLITAIETKEMCESEEQGDLLTGREIEVLRWSAGGKTAEEIATILGISTRTVTFHITSSLTKLNVINKTQAVAKAFLLNIL